MNNTNQIHPTAIIGPNVKMGSNNKIGPHVVIEGNINIGNYNEIGVGCFLYNTVTMGDNNVFTGYASVGLPGEMGTKGDILLDDGGIVIGNNNKIREFVTIQAPVRRKATKIANNCYVMSRAHIPHDAELEDFVVMATNSLIGGGCRVQKTAYIGLGSMTHQWIDIGEGAMVGLLASNTRHVLPYSVVVGSPSRILKFNKVGAERRGVSKEEVEYLEHNYQKVIEGDYSMDTPIVRLIKEFAETHDDSLIKPYSSK